MSGDDNRPDNELLASFAREGCERAFAALVQRHVGLVYSAAFQRLHDAHLAEDVVQAVFVLLARKATQIGRKTILTGWLYRTAQFATNDILKAERRRSKREEISHYLNATGEAPADAGLDGALEQLGEKDRLVILLRFFEEKSIREVGSSVGIGEEAARKRIDRAVDKLRALLTDRNGILPVAQVGQLLSACPKPTLPEGTATRASTVALAGTIRMSTSVLEVVKAASRLMLISRLKRIIPLCVLPLLLIVVSEFQEERGPTAREVMNRHFLALEKNLIKSTPSERNACISCHDPQRTGPTIRGICLRGQWRSVSESLAGQFEIRVAGADRLLERIVVSPEHMIERGRDRELAWINTSKGGGRLMGGAEAATFRHETTLLLWPGTGTPSGFAQNTRFGEDRAYRIQMPNAAEYYFNVETGLFCAAIWQTPGGQGTNVLGSYLEFDGLIAPSQIIRKNDHSEQLFLVQSASIRDFPLKVFDPPPESRAIQ